MSLYFITGNKNKFNEMRLLLPDIEQLNIDLPEIQEIDAREIMRAKLTEALRHHTGEFIVEDSSLYLDCLRGLPGPLVKWFEKTIGNEGIVRLAEHMGDTKAVAKTIIGYARGHGEIYFFEGVLHGRVAGPRGDADWGWGLIFIPDGFSKTFGEMTREEKNAISMRRIAAQKLKDFLSTG